MHISAYFFLQLYVHVMRKVINVKTHITLKSYFDEARTKERRPKWCSG
jgi:hypothetical protein